MTHNMPLVIGLAGYARSGKDTVVQILHDLYGYQRVAFADVLKKVAYDSQARVEDRRIDYYVDSVGGWEEAKRHRHVRELLQGIGIAGREHIHDNVWVDAAFHNAPRGLIAVSDLRFPNEFQAIHQRGGVTWRVRRPGVEAVNAHVSETALDNHIFDQYIDNDGTIEDLARKVIDLMTVSSVLPHQTNRQMQTQRMLRG